MQYYQWNIKAGTGMNNTFAYPWHGKHINVGFVDGHVESATADELANKVFSARDVVKTFDVLNKDFTRRTISR